MISSRLGALLIRCKGAVSRGVFAGALMTAGLLLGAMSTACAAEFTGLIVARHDVLVSPGVPGTVTRMGVEVGQRVKAGQLLLQIDDRMQVLEAQRRRQIFEDDSEIRASRDRIRVLTPLVEDSRKAFQAGGSISREELVRVELDLASTQARLEQLLVQKKREKLEYELADQERIQRSITAPVAGVVTKIELELGEWARPGEPALQLVDADVCWLRVNVTPGAARGLKLEQNLEISFEPVLKIAPIRGRVSYVSPAIDAASGLVEVRVSFQNPGWRVPPGVKASVNLHDPEVTTTR
jgi:RND family efflux transporter MFP subunit